MPYKQLMVKDKMKQRAKILTAGLASRFVVNYEVFIDFSDYYCH